MIRRLLLLVVFAIVLGVAHPGADVRPAIWPTKGWSSSAPEAQKMDSTPLKALDQEFADGKYGYADSFLIVRHGQLVFERAYRQDYQKLFVGKGAPGIYNYYDPGWHPYYKGTDLHTMQSVSKSVTSTLIGIAILRGEIPGIHAKVMPYFSQFKTKPDPRRDKMTLADVLTMTTGIAWDESSVTYTDLKNNCAQMEAREDWIQYVLDQPMAADPGQVFVYNSGATELLSYILEKSTGKHADDYAKEHLFAPLGVDFYWKRTPKGLADTEGGLYLRPRDLAKLGYLFINDGVWDGKRLLPEGWVRDATAWKIETDRKGLGYGYKWWVVSQKGPNSYDAYAALGYGGQYLIVVPELDLIAVFTNWNIYDKAGLTARTALDRVLAAVQDRPR
jgi:CubicO group peptidase (beta-lactamase class C family)